MLYLDTDADDEPCSTLSVDEAEDRLVVANYVAKYGQLYLRKILPREIRRLYSGGNWQSRMARAERQLQEMANDFSDDASYPRAFWFELPEVVQVLKFRSDRDIEIWDFLAAVQDIDEEARSTTSASWLYQPLCNSMNNDLALARPLGDPPITPKTVERIADRLETFLDGFRNESQLKERNRHRELLRRRRNNSSNLASNTEG
jgi:hypothetical protein